MLSSPLLYLCVQGNHQRKVQELKVNKLFLSTLEINNILENVEHCGDEPERADTGILCH